MPLDELKTIDSVGLRLRHLRELVGLTQLDVAERLKVGQTVISRIEKRSDLLLSTIRSYLIAIGGSLDMRAVLETGAIVQLDAITSKLNEIDPSSEQQLSLPGFPAPSEVQNRDVVFSIHPGHAEKILKGEKTVELRRRFTEEFEPGALAMIYTTSPVKALTGVAKIRDVQKLKLPTLWKEHKEKFCVRKNDFDSYFAGLERGYAIHLNEAQPLPRPIYLDELRIRCGFAPPQSFQYASASLRGLVNYERAQGPN
jgi:predicted transcriptional regulator/transcriptional regulator with XRE-family HTH domain